MVNEILFVPVVSTILNCCTDGHDSAITIEHHTIFTDKRSTMIEHTILSQVSRAQLTCNLCYLCEVAHTLPVSRL